MKSAWTRCAECRSMPANLIGRFAMTWKIFVAALITCSSVVASAQALAQERQVTASGTSTITAQPEILRVTVQLQGEGGDVKEALAKLNAEKQASKDKLAALGAAAE